MLHKMEKTSITRGVFLAVALLVASLAFACNKQEGQEPQASKPAQGLASPDAQADDAKAASEQPQEEASYQTATPGVPEELKDGKYDLEEILTVPSLKDSFRDYFKVGVAINGNAVDNAMVNSPELRAVAKYHFNSLTYSNLMKSGYLLDEQGCKKNAENGEAANVAVKFDSCIPGLDFAKENGMGMRGHVLIWHNQVPTWFFRVDYDDDKPFVDKETMLARMESYIKQVLEFTQKEYPGVIYAWDVVNEAVETSAGSFDKDTGWNTRTHYDGLTENLWYTVIGPDYVEKAYEYARAYAAPDVKLFYNDYNTFEIGKSLAISNLIKMLKEKDLIDGLGMQSAYNLNYPSDMKNGPSSVKEALARYSELGVEIHMSEITIRVDAEDDYEKQAQRYKEFFEIVLEMDDDNGGPCDITNVTFFSIMDRYLFYDTNRDDFWMIGKDLKPKQAFYDALGTLEKWKK